jgi:hypothetical protein
MFLRWGDEVKLGGHGVWIRGLTLPLNRGVEDFDIGGPFRDFRQ